MYTTSSGKTSEITRPLLLPHPTYPTSCHSSLWAQGPEKRRSGQGPLGSTCLCPLPSPQIVLQRTELQSLREELHRQKELRAQEDPEAALSCALSDRDEAVNK